MWKPQITPSFPPGICILDVHRIVDVGVEKGGRVLVEVRNKGRVEDEVMV